jgi:hypothetical protein
VPDPRFKGVSPAKAAAVRETFLHLIADGFSVKDACASVGRSLPWYDGARQRYPEWARAVTNARLARKDRDLPGMDFVDFRQVYFGNYTAPHHYRMIEAFELAEPGSLTGVLAWPGSGKTTLLVDMYCHILARDPNDTLCVISEGQDLSRKIIGQVSDRMSDEARFPDYHLRYGPFRARAWDDTKREERDVLKRAWTADYFKILAADADQKEPSLESRGASGRMYGARYKWMIYDDIQSNETLGKTEDLLRSMRTTWSSRTIFPGGKRGKSIMIGSRVGAGDIYEALDDAEMIDNLITIPALTVNIPRAEHFTRINKKIVVNPDCPAQPTWDQMTLHELAEIRHRVGEDVWARTYMQDLVAETSVVFTEEMIENAKDRTRVLGPANLGTDVWCSIDPALDSGVCAYLAVAVSPDHLTVLDSLSVTDTRTYTDIYDRVRAWKVKYRPSLWIVEENNFQKGMTQDDRLFAAANPAHVEAHRTGRNKNDNIMGIRMMANSFADGEIRIPWGDENTQQRMAPLIHELRTWQPHKRGAQLKMDNVMALWFAWMRWQVERETLNNVVPMLWRPTWSSGRRKYA